MLLVDVPAQGRRRQQALGGVPLGPPLGHPVVLRSVGHVLRGNAAYQRVSCKGSRGRVSKCQHLFCFPSRGRGGVSGVGGGEVEGTSREELSLEQRPANDLPLTDRTAHRPLQESPTCAFTVTSCHVSVQL